MTVSKEKHSELHSIIEGLYNNISFDLPHNQLHYAGYLRVDRPFYLDEDGYFVVYQNLKRSIFNIEIIGEKWSKQELDEEIHKLLLNLAEYKDTNIIPNFEDITLALESKIDIEFKEYECVVPIIGLSIDEPLQIGDVTFLPFDAKDKFSDHITDIPIDRLNSDRDCFATTKIKAEWIRSAGAGKGKNKQSSKCSSISGFISLGF